MLSILEYVLRYKALAELMIIPHVLLLSVTPLFLSSKHQGYTRLMYSQMKYYTMMLTGRSHEPVDTPSCTEHQVFFKLQLQDPQTLHI